jgi:GTP1/Obg family GTP-binding protein
MDLRNIVRKTAVDYGINGVMDLKKHCGLSYERTVRVWNGSKEGKFKDVIHVLNSLDKDIEIVDKVKSND